MDADQPMCTAATPKPVRDLEADAMRAYRAKYPDGTLWQELDSSTRCVWVAYTEIQRGTAGVLVVDHQTQAPTDADDPGIGHG